MMAVYTRHFIQFVSSFSLFIICNLLLSPVLKCSIGPLSAPSLLKRVNALTMPIIHFYADARRYTVGVAYSKKIAFQFKDRLTTISESCTLLQLQRMPHSARKHAPRSSRRARLRQVLYFRGKLSVAAGIQKIDIH